MLGPLNGVRAAAGARPVHNPDELLRRAPLMLIATGSSSRIHTAVCPEARAGVSNWPPWTRRCGALSPSSEA
jgi:hypothetical protein